MKKNNMLYRSLVMLFFVFIISGISNKAEAIMTAKIRSCPEKCEVGETIDIVYSTGGLGNGISMIVNIYAIQSANEVFDENSHVLLYSETITEKSKGIISFKVGSEAGEYIGICTAYDYGDNFVTGGGGFFDKVVRVTNGKPLKLFDELNLGKSGWVQKNGKTYYGNQNGIAVLGKREIDGKRYYFNGEGVLQKGWFKTTGGIWHYSNEQGIYCDGNMYGIQSLYIPSYVDALDIYGFGGIGKDFYIQCEPNSYAESFALDYCLQYDNGKKKVIGSNITSREEKIKWIIDNYITSGMSDYEKAERLYDWLQVNSTYDSQLEIHTAEGVLIEGRGVCDSYAKAFCMLLSEVGIENKFMHGKYAMDPGYEGHAWTAVRIDGQWYTSDVVGARSPSPDIVLSSGERIHYGFYCNPALFKNSDPYVDVDKNKVGWVYTKTETYFYDGRPENGGRVTGKYTIDDGEYFFDETGRLIEDVNDIKEAQIKAYVERCYQIIMSREPDEGGLKTWVNELNSGRKTASEIIDRFVNSPEYINKNYNYGDSVDILYQAMLGRSADAAGKANWVKKLESGQTLAHVINGFCFSKEFRGLCETYGIRAGFVNIPNTDTTAEGKIKAFVQRCYRIILDREADPSGMQTWYEQLSSGKKAAAEIIDRFVNSPEFSGKNYSHSDSVEILYKAMLGRGSDAAGKANWINKLDAGQPFAVVINGFCVSREFTGICESYGIKPGSVNVQLSGMAEEEALSRLAYNAKAPITKKSETNPNRVEIINPSDTIDMNIGTAVQAVYINEEKAKEFIGRCYQVILGREASAAELDNWIGQMVNGTKTPDQIARGFLFSNEFKAKNVGNEDLVKILYKVYMNRDADPEGLATWTEKLEAGTGLNDLLNAFSKTGEYKDIVSEMGK